MSEIAHKNLNVHSNKTTALKNKFINEYKTNAQTAQELIRQMRIIHGRAIYDEKEEQKNIFEKGIDNITDQDWIKVSTNCSILHIIHANIMRSEKLAFKNKEETEGRKTAASTLLTSDTDIQTTSVGETNQAVKETSFTNAMASKKNNTRAMSSKIQVPANKMNSTIKTNEQGTDEVSIQNIDTSVSAPSNVNANEFFTEFDTKFDTKGKIASGVTNSVNSTNMSDYIKNLNTSEANRLESEVNKITPTQAGGHYKDVTNPTLVNFWADNCSYSLKFLPTWKEFVAQAKSKYPNLQVVDINANTKEMQKEYVDSAVTGFPTLVMYKTIKDPTGKEVLKKTKSINVASNMSVENINSLSI